MNKTPVNSNPDFKKDYVITHLYLEIPDGKRLGGCRSVSGTSFTYAEISRELSGVQSYTTSDHYNNKLAYFCSSLLDRMEDLIEFHETTKFLIEDSSIHEKNRFRTLNHDEFIPETFKLVVKNYNSIYFKLRDINKFTYDDLVNIIHDEGIPYKHIKELNTKLNVIEPRFKLLKHLNEKDY